MHIVVMRTGLVAEALWRSLAALMFAICCISTSPEASKPHADCAHAVQLCGSMR